MSVRIPGLRAGVLLALCLCVCVNQGLKLKDSSQLVYPIPRHRLWDNSRTVGLEQSMCIETKFSKCGYCSKIPSQVTSKPLISYLPGALIEIKSRVNSTAGGILRVSLCSRSDSFFRSEEEDCRHDMPLVELNSNSHDILLNPSKEVSTSFLLPEEFVCTHCVLQWRFTEVDPSCNGCRQTTINCADISITDGVPYANHVRKKRQSSSRVDPRFIVHNGISDTWNGATQSHWSQQRRGQSWSIPPRQTGAIQSKQQLTPAHMPRTNLQNTHPNRNVQKFQQNHARNVHVQRHQQMSPNQNASPTGNQNFFDPIAQFSKKQTSSASQFQRGFQQPGLPNGLLVKNRQLHQNQHKQVVNSNLHANAPTVNSFQDETNKLNQIQQMFRTGRGGVPQTREFVANGIKRVQTVRIPIERERTFNPNIIDPKYLVVNENEPVQSNQPLIQQMPKVKQATAKPATTAKPKATTSQPTAAPMPPATTIKPKKMGLLMPFRTEKTPQVPMSTTVKPTTTPSQPTTTIKIATTVTPATTGRVAETTKATNIEATSKPSDIVRSTTKPKTHLDFLMQLYEQNRKQGIEDPELLAAIQREQGMMSQNPSSKTVTQSNIDLSQTNAFTPFTQEMSTASNIDQYPQTTGSQPINEIPEYIHSLHDHHHHHPNMEGLEPFSAPAGGLLGGEPNPNHLHSDNHYQFKNAFAIPKYEETPSAILEVGNINVPKVIEQRLRAYLTTKTPKIENILYETPNEVISNAYSATALPKTTFQALLKTESMKRNIIDNSRKIYQALHTVYNTERSPNFIPINHGTKTENTLSGDSNSQVTENMKDSKKSQVFPNAGIFIVPPDSKVDTSPDFLGTPPAWNADTLPPQYNQPVSIYTAAPIPKGEIYTMKPSDASAFVQMIEDQFSNQENSLSSKNIITDRMPSKDMPVNEQAADVTPDIPDITTVRNMKALLGNKIMADTEATINEKDKTEFIHDTSPTTDNKISLSKQTTLALPSVGIESETGYSTQSITTPSNQPSNNVDKRTVPFEETTSAPSNLQINVMSKNVLKGNSVQKSKVRALLPDIQRDETTEPTQKTNQFSRSTTKSTSRTTVSTVKTTQTSTVTSTTPEVITESKPVKILEQFEYETEKPARYDDIKTTSAVTSTTPKVITESKPVKILEQFEYETEKPARYDDLKTTSAPFSETFPPLPPKININMRGSKPTEVENDLSDASVDQRPKKLSGSVEEIASSTKQSEQTLKPTIPSISTSTLAANTPTTPGTTLGFLEFLRMEIMKRMKDRKTTLGKDFTPSILNTASPTSALTTRLSTTTPTPTTTTTQPTTTPLNLAYIELFDPKRYKKIMAKISTTTKSPRTTTTRTRTTTTTTQPSITEGSTKSSFSAQTSDNFSSKKKNLG